MTYSKIFEFSCHFLCKIKSFPIYNVVNIPKLGFSRKKKENLGESPAVREEHLFSAKIRKLPFSKPCQGVRNYESINSQTILAKNYDQLRKTALSLTPQAMLNSS